jgi:hypothetical protein
MSVTKEDLTDALRLLEQKLVRFINSKTYKEPKNDEVDFGYTLLVLKEELEKLQKIQTEQSLKILQIEQAIQEIYLRL